MKIGLVTLNSINYGNRLQNYATQTILRELGHETETILSNGDINYSILYKIKTAIKIFLPLKWRNQAIADSIRMKNFKKFDSKYIKMSRFKIKNNNCTKQAVKYYNSFVCGSDQIWNPIYKCNAAANFLMFAPKEKRLALAPSFGISEMPINRKEEYKEYLQEMEYISIRENTGAIIIKELIGKEVPVLIDPTLMLEKEKWLEIARKPRWLKDEKYILTYFIGDISDNIKNIISNLSRTYGFEIINLLDVKNINWYCTDPSEFLYLIHNCFIMCTDSFHGTVFSILFDKESYVFKRQDNLVSMQTRLDNLIDMFSIECMDFDAITDKNAICYKVPKNLNKEVVLKLEKNKVMEFLNNAFNNCRGTVLRD
jgi:hypothetical protein